MNSNPEHKNRTGTSISFSIMQSGGWKITLPVPVRLARWRKLNIVFFNKILPEVFFYAVVFDMVWCSAVQLVVPPTFTLGGTEYDINFAICHLPFKHRPFLVRNSRRILIARYKIL